MSKHNFTRSTGRILWTHGRLPRDQAVPGIYVPAPSGREERRRAARAAARKAQS